MLEYSMVFKSKIWIQMAWVQIPAVLLTSYITQVTALVLVSSPATWGSKCTALMVLVK